MIGAPGEEKAEEKKPEPLEERVAKLEEVVKALCGSTVIQATKDGLIVDMVKDVDRRVQLLEVMHKDKS